MPLNTPIKPNSLNIKAINPQNPLPYIIHFVLCPVYDLIEEGIKYKMFNNVLAEPQESDTWGNIKERIRIRYNNIHIDN